MTTGPLQIQPDTRRERPALTGPEGARGPTRGVRREGGEPGESGSDRNNRNHQEQKRAKQPSSLRDMTAPLPHVHNMSLQFHRKRLVSTCQKVTVHHVQLMLLDLLPMHRESPAEGHGADG